MTEPPTITVALIGNPNTGKSTLFNALAGVRQRVGNYPGVTVEKKIGVAVLNGQACQYIDLPGTYSLAPRSPDEMIAVDVLLGRQSDLPRVDVVLSIIDASNLERNLYLLSQLLELGVPTVVALNMIDVAEARGIKIDIERLSRQLGVPVVAVQANRRIGLELLQSALASAVASKAPAKIPASPFPEQFCDEVVRLQGLLDRGSSADPIDETGRVPRYLVERLLLDTSGYLQSAILPSHRAGGLNGELTAELLAARTRLSQSGHPIPAVEAQARYGWVAKVVEGTATRPTTRPVTLSDRIDRLLAHRLWGSLVFVAAMLLVFSSVFVAAEPFMNAIEWLTSQVADAVSSRMNPGPLESLIVDGVIGGVGSVLVFLPQIMLLFFFLAILEDCGYMARVAYLMDKLMVRVGLSGKSFIPMLSSFACAIPGIMATRVIENRRDRLTTILVAPLMSCSARLPVYAILIGAFIPRQLVLGILPLQGLTLFAMYLVGIVAAALVALVLKRTLLRGPAPPFVMELPSYKWPSLVTVVHRMVERGWSFVYRAGTLILAVSVLVWAASYYPHNTAAVEATLGPQRDELATRVAQMEPSPEREQLAGQLAEIEGDIVAEYQRQSILGRLGRAIEPAVKPLGWDWRIGCAVIASFPAREVVMGALGVIYHLGSDLDVGESSDQDRLATRMQAARWDDTGLPVYNVPVALSIMVFFALCAQCASTLVVIRRETNSWRWPAFTFVYMTLLAYVGALLTYQIGMRL